MSYATTLCKLTGLHFKVSPIREAAFVFQRFVLPEIHLPTFLSVDDIQIQWPILYL